MLPLGRRSSDLPSGSVPVPLVPVSIVLFRVLAMESAILLKESVLVLASSFEELGRGLARRLEGSVVESCWQQRESERESPRAMGVPSFQA